MSGRRDFLSGLGRQVAKAVTEAAWQGTKPTVGKPGSLAWHGSTRRMPSAGPPVLYVPGQWVFLEDVQCWLSRDRLGFFAVDGRCMHMGCWLKPPVDGEFVCGCHGSRFAVGGARLDGPASRDLRFVKVSLAEDGRLVVDRWVEVVAGERYIA